jgi:hypothetical protein
LGHLQKPPELLVLVSDQNKMSGWLILANNHDDRMCKVNTSALFKCKRYFGGGMWEMTLVVQEVVVVAPSCARTVESLDHEL